MRLGITLSVLLLVSQSASAAVLHVPADYPTIQQALDVATGADIVLVAPGTYYEHLLMGTPQSDVKLHSEAGAASTIIDGSGTNFVLYLSNDGPGTEIVGFTIQNGIPGIRAEGSAPLISDCIIQNNQGSGGGGIFITGGPAQIVRNVIRDNSASTGGGVAGPVSLFDSNIVSGNHAVHQSGGAQIYGPGLVVSNNQFISNQSGNDQAGALYVGGDMTVRGNLFQGNSSTLSKGGAIAANDAGTIEGNTFIGNSAGQGGGAIALAYLTNTCHVSKNYFQDNTSPGLGGAIYCDFYSQATIADNVIVRNNSTAGGGGLAIHGYATPTVTGNTIVLNSASPDGGGVYVGLNAQPVLQRNIVSHTQAGGGVFRDASSTVTFQCNDVWGNSGYDFSGLPNPTGTQGNISSDPLYCGFASLDFHIAGPSLCAPAHSGICGLIGALDVGCDAPVRTETTTWGGLKARYR